jgi:predicted phosphodiesterase
MGGRHSTTWVAVSCPHVPLHCRKAHKTLVSRLQDLKPKYFILLGDGMDGAPASVHKHEHEWDALTEFEQFAKYLRSLREAAGNDTEFVWLHGNHDANYYAPHPDRIARSVRKLVHWDVAHTSLREEARLWKQVPYSHRQVFRLGPVTFQHGCEHGVNATRDQCQLYTPEYGLYVGGHTHRPEVVTPAMMTPRIPLNKHKCNAGCQLDFSRVDYMERKSMAAWGHAMAYGEANADKKRIRFGSVQWDANVEIWEMGL